MKKIAIIIFLFNYLFCFSQKQEKETVYLLFDKSNKEKCLVEDGSGNSKHLSKYRKQYLKKVLFFKICNETFAFNSKKKSIDTCSTKAMNNIKLVNLKYLIDKKSKKVLRYNPFEKIYIVEKTSNDIILKYEVTWIDDWVMIEN